MSKIIDFPSASSRLESEKGLSVKRKPKYCKCVFVEVDIHTRSLKCRSCGATVDSFDWALSQCQEWQVLENQRQLLKAEIKSSTKSLAETKRQLKNAKASLGRAKKVMPKAELRCSVTDDWVGDLQKLRDEL